ncbi:MAG: Rieske 2Fe-2S domain-containing protein, partial [Phycisphaerales bacterium]
MSVSYSAVGWNRQKLLYDGVLLGGVSLFLVLFVGIGKLIGIGGANPDARHDDAMLLLRGLGIAALALLHIILWTGPLARLDARLLPLLYNRRHMGVTMCLLGIVHAALT